MVKKKKKTMNNITVQKIIYKTIMVKFMALMICYSKKNKNL